MSGVMLICSTSLSSSDFSVLSCHLRHRQLICQLSSSFIPFSVSLSLSLSSSSSTSSPHPSFVHYPSSSSVSFSVLPVLSDVPGEPQLTHVWRYCASPSPFHNAVRRAWWASTHPRLAVLRFTFSFPQCCRTCLPSLNSPTFGGIALHLLLSTMLSDVPGGLGPPKSDGVAFSFSTIQSYSSSSYIQHHPFQHSYRHHVHFSGVHFQLQQYKVYEIRFSSHVR